MGYYKSTHRNLETPEANNSAIITADLKKLAEQIVSSDTSTWTNLTLEPNVASFFPGVIRKENGAQVARLRGVLELKKEFVGSGKSITFFSCSKEFAPTVEAEEELFMIPMGSGSSFTFYQCGIKENAEGKTIFTWNSHESGVKLPAKTLVLLSGITWPLT